MTDEQFEKRIGTVLRGKWTLERLLGAGGMAAVYVGAHRIGRRDAIKIMHPEVARSKDLRARFEQEAHAVNRLGHPGAVQIRDIDTDDDGALFLVMELLEGEPLHDRAQRLRDLPVDEVLEHAERLLDVLAAAHAQGVIHRDVKLDNIFITKDGGLKLLDFGIAQVRSEAAKSMHTRPGSTLGTVSYMPPEQIKGLPIDPRADVFAVGATMFRLLAKRKIHEARTESEMVVKMATEAAPPLRSVAPNVPPSVCAIVDRALAFDRERRYPSALTMRADVQAVRRGEQPPYASSAVAEPSAAAPSGRGADRTAATVAPGAGAARLLAADPTEVGPAAPVGAPAAATVADRTEVGPFAAPVVLPSPTVAERPSRNVPGSAAARYVAPSASIASSPRSSASQAGVAASAARPATHGPLPRAAPWLLGVGVFSIAAFVMAWWLAADDDVAASDDPAAATSVQTTAATAAAAPQRGRELDKLRDREKERAKEAEKQREREKERRKEAEKKREKD